MLIKKIHREVKVPLSLKIDQTLMSELTVYSKMYSEVYGDQIETTEVIEELLKVSLKKDRTFQKYLKEQTKD